jgi:hypothetical protein
LLQDERGNLVLDVRRFHDIVLTQPTEAFPYPQPADAPSPEPPALTVRAPRRD